MKVGSGLFLILSVFCLSAGATYGIWGHEVAGTLFLCVLGVAFAYLAVELRKAAAGDQPEDQAAPVDADGPPLAEAQSFHASAPSLTPLFFAIAAGLVVAGLVFSQWLVIAGGAMVVVVLIVWFVETGARREAEEAAKAGHGSEHP